MLQRFRTLNETGSTTKIVVAVGSVLFAVLLVCPSQLRGIPQGEEEIQDISGTFDFLSADDTLSILDQEGKLDGSLDVYQNAEESDSVLSFEIKGTRKKGRVEFQTNRIHQKSYRFHGSVQRGAGLEEKDPDYMELVGDVEIISTKGDSNEESVQRMHMIFKSRGKEAEEQN